MADSVLNVLFRFKGIRFIEATPESYPRISRFLAEQQLAIEDLSPDRLSGFELAVDRRGKLVGIAGIEVFGDDALLRSVAVAHGWRRKGIGRVLVERREAAAREAGVRTLYLLSDSVLDFFASLSYQRWPRETVPAAIGAHAQFRVFCPASAACFRKDL